MDKTTYSQEKYANKALPHYVKCVEAFVQGRYKTNLMRSDMHERTIAWKDAALPKLDFTCLRLRDRERVNDQVASNIAKYQKGVTKGGKFEDVDTDSHTQYAKIRNFGSIHSAALSEDWLPSERPTMVMMLPMPVSD
jgi:hypothetical protein